jgi:hypothetical protein
MGIPRLLGLMDRTPYSPTFGCMDREYWLCRTTDFPSSIAQFGVHALALAWAHDMPDNPYRGHPKVLEWVLGGMDYFCRIQKRDGSFDEFYPNERGWAGPTGFLVYAMVESYRLVREHVGPDLTARFLDAIERAAVYLYEHDESGVLANHHAMALLPIYDAYDLLGHDHIRDGFERRRRDFLGYCYEEGWCLEYDGADLGYLSATVSFLGKLRRMYRDDELDGVLERAIELSSHFAYPNGSYAGSLGSRQTLHFYPHGYEMLGSEWPLAHAVADHMLAALARGRLVPPEIQEDRYFVYRVPEMLLSYVDYGARAAETPPLPWQRGEMRRWWPGARLLAERRGDLYLCANLAKGGVVKAFDVRAGRILASDCGFVAELESGDVATSQWIDPDHCIEVHEDGFTVSGRAQKMVTKHFDPMRFMLFRAWILSVGWNTALAYHAKGLIRKLLMLGSRPMPLRFERSVTWADGALVIEDTLSLEGSARVRRLRIGDEFPVRYVPQSRYFQPDELEVGGRDLSEAELAELNDTHTVALRREVSRDGADESEIQGG